MIKLKLACPVHPRYKAIRPPRVTGCYGAPDYPCTCPGIWAIAQWGRNLSAHPAIVIHGRLRRGVESE